jgi:hypothetical protein
MSSAYFAPLVLLPEIITEPGQYQTRCGEVVTVVSISQKYRHDFENRGSYPNGVAERWHKSGRIFATSTTDNDIVARLS